MSKISQELKVLLYLNDNSRRSRWVTINEIANYLEISDRQARRYLEDLNLITDIHIETKLGRNGGYRLETSLDKGLEMPENLVLAMSIAMRRNERIEKVLSELPNYVICERVEGDNYLDNETLDKLDILLKAIKNQKEINVIYDKYNSKYYLQPYKIFFTNRTYYLCAVDVKEEKLKKYDVKSISNIQELGSFKIQKKVLEEINANLHNYGVKTGVQTTLRVKCDSKEVLNKFDKYFEGKGEKNDEELTYVVKSGSENELFYPLFRIGTKGYTILDESFKESYVRYLFNQIKSIERK